jgi:hypothetical protein
MASNGCYIQHYFYGFYVFQYATSITAANYFADKVAHGTVKDRENYLSVLRAGGSDYGYNILKKAGLDMATATPYQTIIRSLLRRAGSGGRNCSPDPCCHLPTVTPLPGSRGDGFGPRYVSPSRTNPAHQPAPRNAPNALPLNRVFLIAGATS